MTHVSEKQLKSELETEHSLKLPEAFVNRMKTMLGDEYAGFATAYDKERLYGLRYNPLKSSREEFLKKTPFNLTPVPWCNEGFYYDKCAYITDESQLQPGKHPFHEAGAYYIQEPSAMAAAEALAPEAGERILDLCAAPGGKTTHIAGKMMGKGLLVSNEIVPDRARILSQNVERMGIPNAVVCNETPDRLAGFFPMFFDRILVDAPCSGEGMFRKEQTAIDMWSPTNVEMCADRQLDILEQTVKMLKSGGVLVYSTCTFSPQENEGVISEFIRRHDEFVVEETKLESFFSQGEGNWVENPAKGIEHTMRLWPHKIAGEGHFIAKLRKADGLNPKPLQIKGQGGEEIKLCMEFLGKELGTSNNVLDEFEQSGRFVLFGEQIYLVPAKMIPLKGIKVIRAGLHLGMNKKNRFEPAHALALYLKSDEVKRHYEMTQEETTKYLRGETFICDAGLKGWTLLTTGGYSIGFGKAGGGQMKNHYPKGLRKLW